MIRLAESISFFDIQKDSLRMYVCQRQHHYLVCHKGKKNHKIKKSLLVPSRLDRLKLQMRLITARNHKKLPAIS
jgi:hypothetical protein